MGMSDSEGVLTASTMEEEIKLEKPTFKGIFSPHKGNTWKKFAGG